MAVGVDVEDVAASLSTCSRSRNRPFPFRNICRAASKLCLLAADPVKIGFGCFLILEGESLPSSDGTAKLSKLERRRFVLSTDTRRETRGVVGIASNGLSAIKFGLLRHDDEGVLKEIEAGGQSIMVLIFIISRRRSNATMRMMEDVLILAKQR